MITFSDVSAQYASATSVITHFNFALDKGAFGVITGPSGSGKSTLLKLLLRELLPSNGSIQVGPYTLSQISKRELSKYRQSIGIVFQDLKLLKDKTIFENVSLPLELQKKLDRKQIEKHVAATLERLSISHAQGGYPDEISQSEQQRVAIARAVITEPLVVIADEPTGQLDEVSSSAILQLLQNENLRGMTILMLTNGLAHMQLKPTVTASLMTSAVPQQGVEFAL